MDLLQVILYLSFFRLGSGIIDINLEVIRDGAGKVLLGWLVVVEALLDDLR